VRERAVSGGLQTVAAALDLLDCFAEDEELGVTEVSRRLDVAKSTAHRLLVTLTSRGICEQNSRTGKYRLGLHLYELGQLAVTRTELRRCARSLLEELREVTGWTVQLSVASGVDTLVLERLMTTRSVKALPDFNRRMPGHITAHGKALCAFDPDFARRRIDAGLPRATEFSITDPKLFQAELDVIRRRGHATATGEAMAGVSSVAAPVLDSRGIAVAALAINGPPEEIVPMTARLGRLLQASGRRLAKDMRSDILR
jgi:DNA-binding IclR family transcriptional regulator